MGRLIRYNHADLESYVEQSTQSVIQPGRRLTPLTANNQ
jgi:hypothetical protein